MRWWIRTVNVREIVAFCDVDFCARLREKLKLGVAMKNATGQKTLWSRMLGSLATWDSCVEHAKEIELEWSLDTPTPIATMPSLEGWRIPLWAVESNRLWLLRPEGVWRASLQVTDMVFMLRERVKDDYRGALFVDPSKKGKVWRFPTGAPVDLVTLDNNMSPPSIQLFADYVGALQSCGQDGDGICRIELDDHFETGPLKLRRHGPWLLVSNDQITVAYGLGETSRMWELFEKHPCRVVLGSESFTSWVPRTVLTPVMLDLSHSR